jgi:hypothetical protein
MILRRLIFFGLASSLVFYILSSVVVAEDRTEREEELSPDKAATTEELAKAAQNPVADLISLPLQNNTNFGIGPDDKTQNILNIQPVLPFSLNDNWNLITRTILPVISQPGLLPGQDRTNGLGDTIFTAFFSPKNSARLIWGVGPAILIQLQRMMHWGRTSGELALQQSSWLCRVNGLSALCSAMSGLLQVQAARMSICLPGSIS